MNRRALGRGLRALIPEGDGGRERVVHELPLGEIEAGAFQPRGEMDEEALAELTESIRAHGVLEPVVVRPRGGRYELVVGERRWRAAQRAGLSTVPALVRDVGDREAAALALVENLQRQDLNPLEEAAGYQRLMEEFGLSQEEVAAEVGRKRSTIANSLRLLSLEPEIRADIAAGRLGGGHGKALLAVEDPEGRRRLWEKVREHGLSVREAEALAREMGGRGPRAARGAGGPAAGRRKGQGGQVAWRPVEERLRELLGTRVRVVEAGPGRGRIEIEFYSPEDVNRIVEVLLGEEHARELGAASPGRV